MFTNEMFVIIFLTMIKFGWLEHAKEYLIWSLYSCLAMTFTFDMFLGEEYAVVILQILVCGCALGHPVCRVVGVSLCLFYAVLLTFLSWILLFHALGLFSMVHY